MAQKSILIGNLLVGLSDQMSQLAIISNKYRGNARKDQKAKFDKQKFKNEFTSVDWDKVIMVKKEDPNLAFNEFYGNNNNCWK